MAQGVFTPYSTIASFFQVLPSWVSQEDQERIASYQTYEEIYWSHPETFKLVLRGTENKPIYVPSGRTIVETANRYVGKGLGFMPEGGEGQTQESLRQAMTALFRRERFYSKYNSSKHYGLMRGDWLFHITANGGKEPGSRLSIKAVDPAAYFPVSEDQLIDGGDPDNIVRVHLVDQLVVDGKDLIRRQTYEKTEAGIMSSLAIFEPDKWHTTDGSAVQIVTPPFLLPPAITSIPVYHIKNFEEPIGGISFGSSEMRGIERLMAAINQAVSDEDIALALEGLGLYTTDGGGPVDDEGEPVDWILGPGRVVENAPGFKRVPGIGSITPWTDHINTLDRFMKEASGTPDAAIGKIDVQVAESGVALALQLAPMLTKAEEKDVIIQDVLNQMFFDIATMWFPTYEQMSFGTTVPVATFGEKLPKNRKAILDEVTTMMMSDPPLMSATTGRQILQKELGVEFSEDELARIIQEKSAMADPALSPTADPDAARMAEEAAAE